MRMQVGSDYFTSASDGSPCLTGAPENFLGGRFGSRKPSPCGGSDHPHAFAALLVGNLAVEFVHLRPVHLRAEMVLGVVAVIEPKPVVDLVIAAHAPRNRLVGIAAEMEIVAVQIREAVAKIIERQERRR